MSPTGSEPLDAGDPRLDLDAHLAEHLDERHPGRVEADVRPSCSSASGWSAAATSQADAAEGSPGTSSSNGRSFAGPVTVVMRPSRWIGTPMKASIRSVWSRVGPGVSMIVSPVALSPASAAAPSTWALATGS